MDGTASNHDHRSTARRDEERAMTEDRDDRAWFAPKRYGYGSGLPVRWQGWVVLALFVLVVITAALTLKGVERIAVFAIAILLFTAICAVKTRGGWKWRWGSRDT
jgi:hypothetical protein